MVTTTEIVSATTVDNNEKPVSLPVATDRYSKAGNKLGTEISFRIDPDGNPLQSPSNARKYLRETQPDLKGNDLTVATEELWQSTPEAWDRALATLAINDAIDKGMRPVFYRKNEKETIGEIKFKKATTPKATDKIKELKEKAEVAAETAIAAAAVRLAEKMGISVAEAEGMLA